MAKSKNKKNNYSRSVRRTTVRRDSFARRSLHNYQDTEYTSLDLSPVYVQTRRGKTRVKPRDPEVSQFQARKINYGAFHAPIDINLKKEDYICARRKIRREVIHAIGAGGTKVKKPRYTSQSKFTC